MLHYTLKVLPEIVAGGIKRVEKLAEASSTELTLQAPYFKLNSVIKRTA